MASFPENRLVPGAQIFAESSGLLLDIALKAKELILCSNNWHKQLQHPTLMLLLKNYKVHATSIYLFILYISNSYHVRGITLSGKIQR